MNIIDHLYAVIEALETDADKLTADLKSKALDLLTRVKAMSLNWTLLLQIAKLLITEPLAKAIADIEALLAAQA